MDAPAIAGPNPGPARCGPRRWRRAIWPAAALVAAIIAIGCNRLAAPGVDGELGITSPRDGATVDTNPLTVTGTAPPGALVVRDITLAPDDEATADADGHWSMEVDLDEGENLLTFRLGDDQSTASGLSVVYSGAAMALAITTPEDDSETEDETVAVRGMASPGATVVHDIAFAPDDRATADADGTWEIEATLVEGRNELIFRLDEDEDVTASVTINYRAGTAETTPRATPRATPTAAIDAACLTAFENAAAVDPMADTVEDLYPAVRACTSISEWTAAFDATDGAGFADNPLLVLANLCSSGDDLAGTSLCQELIATSD